MHDFLTEVGSDLAPDASALPLVDLARQMNIVGGPAEAPFPLNVGLLFFNAEPRRFFPATQIDVVSFPEGAGGDSFFEMSFHGPLHRMVREALDYIRRNYVTQIVIKHPGRAEATRAESFPFAAIEEAVVNAVYHRSYEEREPVEVRVYAEELVVLSYPGPDRSVRLDQLRLGRAMSRRYRNRRIGEFLKELDLTEGRSTGIPKILRAMRENGSPAPEFETDHDHSYFLVRLPAHPQAQGGGARPGRHPEEAPAGTKSGLSGDQVELLRQVQSEQSIPSLMAAAGRANRTKFRDQILNPLLDAGLVEMTIPDKPTSSKQRYRVTERGRRILASLQDIA